MCAAVTAGIARIEELLKEMNVNWALSEVFARGGEGGKDLAEKVLKSLDKKYTLGGWSGWKPWHGHYVAKHWHCKSCA